MCERKISFILRHYIIIHFIRPRSHQKASSNNDDDGGGSGYTPQNPSESLICISVPADHDAPRTPPPSPDSPPPTTTAAGGISPFIIITRLFITLCKYNADGYIIIIIRHRRRRRRLPSNHAAAESATHNNVFDVKKKYIYIK